MTRPVLRVDQIAVPGALQLVAERGRAAVLPDDGVMDRLAGAAVPDDVVSR